MKKLLITALLALILGNLVQAMNQEGGAFATSESPLVTERQEKDPVTARRRPHPEAQITHLSRDIILSPDKLADLAVYPQHPTPHSHEDELTIGDLHGNALKLIYFLIRESVISIPEEEYEELRGLYYRGGFNYQTCCIRYDEIMRFQQIIRKAIILSEAPFVRLLGDEMSDRGKNDYFTLLVLEKLASHRRIDDRPMFEILLSNHSFNFIYQMQSGKEPNRIGSHESSRDNLIEIMQTPEVRMHAETIFNEIYLKHLKVISYTVINNPHLSYDKEIYIYSHAPIGLESIRMLAKHYDISECQIVGSVDSDMLVHCIDRVNDEFMRNIHGLHKEYEIEGAIRWKDKGNAKACEKESLPFTHLTWNRNPNYLERPEFAGEYALTFVHGHDGRGEVTCGGGHSINLDNEFGKDSTYSGSSSSLDSACCWAMKQPPMKQFVSAYWDGVRPEKPYLGRYNYLLLENIFH